MKILFAGTPEIAVPALAALIEKGVVAGVLTNPDEPVGRKRVMTPPPVKDVASAAGIPVFQPVKLDDDHTREIWTVGADLLVSFAYGKIFPPAFLERFSRGGINIHPSLLPRHRGPSPLPAAILAGDPVTGITLQTLARKMDCGDILMQRELPLTGEETTGTLTRQVADLVPGMITGLLDRLERNEIVPVPQPEEGITYCSLIGKGDGLADWSLPAGILYRQYRAYTPWPGFYTVFDGQQLILMDCHPVTEGETEAALPPGTVAGVDKQKGILIQTGQGLLAVTELKLQSRKAMDYRSFLNGMPGLVGCRLGGEY